jgi:hypothetical protein
VMIRRAVGSSRPDLVRRVTARAVPGKGPWLYPAAEPHLCDLLSIRDTMRRGPSCPAQRRTDRGKTVNQAVVRAAQSSWCMW